MKRCSLYFIALLFISCGKSPLFGPIETEENKVSSIAGLSSSEERVWGKSKTRFGLQWLNKPSIGSNSPFNIKFWDSSQTNFLGPYSFQGEKLCVFLWMTMPDGSEHGSSPVELTRVSADSGDYYFVDEVYFIMPGNWQVRIRTVEEQAHCRGDKNDPFIEEEIIEIPNL